MQCVFVFYIKKRNDKNDFFLFYKLFDTQCCPGLRMFSNDLKIIREHFIDECLCNKLHLYTNTLQCRYTNIYTRNEYSHKRVFNCRSFFMLGIKFLHDFIWPITLFFLALYRIYVSISRINLNFFI